MKQFWWEFGEIDDCDIDAVETGTGHQANINLATGDPIHWELSANLRSIRRSIDRYTWVFSLKWLR